MTGQSVQQIGNQYIGTMTLTTDADLMRIRKIAGTSYREHGRHR